MKRQLGGLLAGALVASALGAASGWAWSELNPAGRSSATSKPVEPGCRSGSCCTLWIAAQSLTSDSLPAANRRDCCEPSVDASTSP